MFFDMTNDCDKMFEYALMLIQEKDHRISEMDDIIERLIKKLE